MTVQAIAEREDSSLNARAAEEIRGWMGKRRISGARLARELGVSDAWVSYRLSGKQAIDLNDLERIAHVLRVPPLALLPQSTERSLTTTDQHLSRAEQLMAPTPAAASQPNGGRRTFPTSTLPQTDEVPAVAYGFQPSRTKPFVTAPAIP